MTDVFVKLLDLKPGESVELSADEAHEFYFWTNDIPRTPEEVRGALWRYNVKLERNDHLHAIVATKSISPLGPSPFTDMPATEFAARQKRWLATGSYDPSVN